MIWVSTSPVRTPRAATNEAVPWRRYSNSSRAGVPGVAGRPGGLERAAIAVFSSMDSSTASVGGLL
jgi:hypothetical protein